MKAIALPNKELRLLSLQLQSFNQGYTVEQIRLLDKIIRNVETILKPFNDSLEKINKMEIKEGTEVEKIESQRKKEHAFNELISNEGEKEVTISVEDQEFNFIQAVWNKTATFSGISEARGSIIKIDDVLNHPTEKVFTEANKLIN